MHTLDWLILERDARYVMRDASLQIIARKLLESKQTIPHYYLSIDCEMDALMR
jgi:pyruvate dehydrogenase E2 component (dihydrolipoamide acetyltransferase)